MATAGQVMLSTAGSGILPRVTLRPAWVSAELRAPATARLLFTNGDCAVFHGVKSKRVMRGSAINEVEKRWTPSPVSLEWRLRQTAALAWLAMPARWSSVTEESDSRVVMN